METGPGVGAAYGYVAAVDLLNEGDTKMTAMVAARSEARANLYAAVAPIVALLAGVGVVTDAQGVAVAALATETITLGFATYQAARNRVPLTRTLIYGFLTAAAGAAVAWGVLGADTADLIVPAVMGVLGIVVAQSTTQPHVESDPRRAVDANSDGVLDVWKG